LLSILDLPDADLILRCPVCAYQMKFTGEDTRYEKLSISTKYSTAQLAEDAPSAVPAFTRAKVKEKCPQCNNPEMSFYTVRHNTHTRQATRSPLHVLSRRTHMIAGEADGTGGVGSGRTTACNHSDTVRPLAAIRRRASCSYSYAWVVWCGVAVA
jgi:DNA-directed RNA polymerase subunit M/transcription elongation factor TFIIS